MKLIISILLFSTVTFASGANHKYFITKKDWISKRSVASKGVITPESLKGNFEKIAKTLCVEKAFEKFTNYSRLNPTYLVNLSTLRLEDEKKVAGAQVVTYSMDFLITDKIVPMTVNVSSVDSLCF